MTKDHALDDLARELRSRIAPNFDSLTVVPEEKDSPPIFAVYPTRRMTQNEVVSACIDMAMVIRQVIPERSNGWSAAILVEPSFGVRRTIYFLGWTGRTDHWQLAIA